MFPDVVRVHILSINPIAIGLYCIRGTSFLGEVEVHHWLISPHRSVHVNRQVFGELFLRVEMVTVKEKYQHQQGWNQTLEEVNGDLRSTPKEPFIYKFLLFGILL